MKKKWLLRAGIPILALGLGFFGVYEIKASIPDTIYTPSDESVDLQRIADYPMVDLVESVSASQNGTRTIDCYLANTFLLKQIEVKTTDPLWVEASGMPVGIYMETNGVLVIDTQELEDANGNRSCPVGQLIQAGDYLQKINGEELDKKSQLISCLETYAGGDLVFTILRDGEVLDIAVEPMLTTDGTYKLGLWIRDNSQGIGTLTYTTEDGTFAALGHGISDVDTGNLLDLKNGKLYKAQIMDVKKGSAGNPGELSGIIYYDSTNELGSIKNNEICGIFGDLRDSSRQNQGTKRKIEVAFKQEMQEGDASILCNVEDTVREYGVTIEKIYWNARDTNKCFILRVTDPALLEKTGGIVQGMSGSPVLQNGKLVGAVTHVFVQDATSGYGVFIENMMKK